MSKLTALLGSVLITVNSLAICWAIKLIDHAGPRWAGGTDYRNFDQTGCVNCAIYRDPAVPAPERLS